MKIVLGDITPIFTLTGISFIVPWLLLWFSGKLSIGKMIMLLFVFDIVLTIEAGIESNVVEIYVLHVITIPAFFGLIYLDILAEQKAHFSCFICGKAIAASEPSESVKKLVDGRYTAVLVHVACIELDNKHRKTFSGRLFRKGIPQ